MPAKPVMKVTGETNIGDFMKRVLDDDKMYFKDLAAVKGGVPSEGCAGFLTPPNPADHNEGKAWWIRVLVTLGKECVVSWVRVCSRSQSR